MNILGISAYYHDSAACLLQDGRIVHDSASLARGDDVAITLALGEVGATVTRVTPGVTPGKVR